MVRTAMLVTTVRVAVRVAAAAATASVAEATRDAAAVATGSAVVAEERGSVGWVKADQRTV